MESNDNPRNIKMDDFSKMLDINERIKFLLNFAVLAPSTHNTQPWLFKIRNSGCEIFYDPKLSLPEADVKQRDLYISMGCCIENLSLASKYFGMFDSVDFGPFTEKHQVAVIKFREHPSEKNQDFREILNTIVARRNARGIFSGEKDPTGIPSCYYRVQNFSKILVFLAWVFPKFYNSYLMLLRKWSKIDRIKHTKVFRG